MSDPVLEIDIACARAKANRNLRLMTLAEVMKIDELLATAWSQTQTWISTKMTA